MKLPLILAAAGGVLATAPIAQAAPAVEFRDAVVRVTVIPEDRPDVKVEVVRTNAKLPLVVRIVGDTTVIDGDLGHRISSCHGWGDDRRVHVRGVGDVDRNAMPEVVVHTPRAVAASSSGAVVGSVGRAASLDLRDSGCSAWTLGNVDGQAELHESGAGQIRMGSAGRLETHISGAAKIYAVEAHDLDVVLSGAGLVRLERLTGPMEARVSGAGHIDVLDGRAAQMRAAVSGVGAIDFGGVADTLDASISGIGSIRVREVQGPVRKSVSGAGHVSIG